MYCHRKIVFIFTVVIGAGFLSAFSEIQKEKALGVFQSECDFGYSTLSKCLSEAKQNLEVYIRLDDQTERIDMLTEACLNDNLLRNSWDIDNQLRAIEGLPPIGIRERCRKIARRIATY